MPGTAFNPPPPHLAQANAAVAPPPRLMTPPQAVPLPIPAPAASPRVLVGFLVTFQTSPSGVFWPLYGGNVLIGRAGAEGVDVALGDASVSSRQAIVIADGLTGLAYVEDAGSRNGTFVNEQRLTPGERRQLRDSDRLRTGSTLFVVKLLVL